MNIISVSLTGTLAEVVKNYTGRELEDLEVVPDPEVPAVYALQATFTDGQRLQMLLKDVALNKVTIDDIEEVEFTSWPPTSNGFEQAGHSGRWAQ